ncbi:MAG: AAA family ATPase [Pseudonocardiaceae bacterium]|nr:AAA family ATPase [Pseudonocardiaceae bacterium]
MPQLAVGVDFLSEFARLQGPVQRRTKEALAKFGEHTHAGLHLEKVSGARDDRARTIRIDQFWRGVVLAPEQGDRYVLLRVMPHDDASAWAKSHRFTVNEVSGVLEVRDVEALEQLAAESPAESDPEPERLFGTVSDADLRRLGIDEQVLTAAHTVTDEQMLDAIAPLLPENQSDVLYALASGMTVEEVWADIVAPRVPAEHIDTGDLGAAAERSRGRVALVDRPEELLALFDKPLALWRVFLHPSQEQVAYRPTYWGSAQVTGGPGTGKTVVALHRVRHLVSRRELPSKSVLLTTFNRGLADALDRDLPQLLDPDERQAVQVVNVDRWANGVVRAEHGPLDLVSDDHLRERMRRAATEAEFSPAFLLDEWRHVVLAHAITDGDAYLAASRRGRGRGLGKAQKRRIWSAIERFQAGLRDDRVWTWLGIADEAARLVRARERPPFRHVVVDEIQDLHPAHWRLLRAAAPLGPDDLFLTGDPHQRIYGNHVSLRRVGITVSGRSTRLQINYRTTAEILHWSLGVLGDLPIGDLDEGTDTLTGYRSALHGEPPVLAPADMRSGEVAELATALRGWHDDGVEWGDMAVVARTNRVARRIATALGNASISTTDLHNTASALRVGTMHGMKGLEFRCVAVADVGRDSLPLPQAVTPESEDPVRHALDVQQERCLLFVACTRARERLRISWSGPRSELLPRDSHAAAGP